MDPELAKKIVEQVVAALGKDVPAARSSVAVPAPAGQRPSARLAQDSLGENAAAKDPQASDGESAGRAVARVFVTRDELSQRAAASGGGAPIQLAHNEFLTPSALDLVDERHLAVSKAPAPSPMVSPAPQKVGNKAGSNPAAAGSQASPQRPDNPPSLSAASLGLVTDRTDAKVASAAGALAYDGLAIMDFNRTDCWIINLQGLCEAVAAGTVSAGVAVLPYAADAMVLANKIKGIRAVQGTRLDSMVAAIRHFGANVLIVEHAFKTFHEIRAMVRAFVGSRPDRPAATTLVAALAALEGA